MLTEENLGRIRALNEIAQGRGQTLAQLALAWTLRDARMTSTLIGASSVRQLDDNLAALRTLEFTDAELAEIDRYRRGERHQPLGPVERRMIAVVGSCNVDFVVPVPVLPGPGETVLGGDHLRTPGGKGANQAVAAAKLGSPVAFVGCVGDDALAPTILSALDGAGVDTSWLRRVPDAPSGIALITVADGGENTIAVSPGANARLGPADIDAAAELLAGAAVTLVQLEIPLDAVAATVRAAGGRVVLNPAPARELPAGLLAGVDVLVPNRSELAVLAGAPEPSTSDDAAALAARLDGPRAVVVTLGADGARGRRERPPDPRPGDQGGRHRRDGRGRRVLRRPGRRPGARRHPRGGRRVGGPRGGPLDHSLGRPVESDSRGGRLRARLCLTRQATAERAFRGGGWGVKSSPTRAELG